MKTLLLMTLLLVAGTLAASNARSHGFRAAPCNVQGVWELSKTVTNGKTDSSGAGQAIKVMTKNHFAWIQQESRRDTLPLKTFRDSVRVFSDAGGYGTYTISGSSLTEHIEMFPNPTYIAKDWPATCQTTGTSWIHAWISPEYADSVGRMRKDTVTEYYRRVE